MTDKCNINKVLETFQIIISERYASYNNQGQLEEQDAGATSDGSMITIFIGLDTLFANALKQLDQNFEVSSEKRAQAEANFKILDLNQTLMRIMCAATMASGLDRKGASRQEAEQAIEKANQIAEEYRDMILNGQINPAVVVYRSSKGII